jgi:hypothetical protein
MYKNKIASQSLTQGLRSLKNVLPENANKILKKEGFSYFEIIKNWKNIVGIELYKETTPLKIKKINNENILFISVNKKIMIEIEYSKDQIIDKINQYLGFNSIQKIFVHTKNSSINSPAKKKLVNDNILNKINSIKNVKLKELFLKLTK